MVHYQIFPASLDYLYDMLSFIENYPLLNQLDPALIDQIILATEEAIVNIINYGYQGLEKGTIEITCEKVNEKPGLKIVIKDQGVPFNPIEHASALPHPSATLDKKTPIIGGYGIYIFIEIMDFVEYQRVKENNILSLIKYY